MLLMHARAFGGVGEPARPREELGDLVERHGSPATDVRGHPGGERLHFPALPRVSLSAALGGRGEYPRGIQGNAPDELRREALPLVVSDPPRVADLRVRSLNS